MHIPGNAPTNIKMNSLHLQCKNHKYLYYPEDWNDTATGKSYSKGYYDENGRHYTAEEITFRRKDGSYIASYKCEYCGHTAEYEWREGQSPNCNSCGAAMTKVQTYIDDIVEVTKASVYTGYDNEVNTARRRPASAAKIVAISIGAPLAFATILTVATVERENRTQNNNSSNGQSVVSNVDIYGRDLYLDEIDTNVYVICDETDDYEKHLTWDYGQDSYYDRESDCYIWYNTDVSPNLWQYWYEDISGSNAYGWMEYETDTWYIEKSANSWKAYSGDTSKLWHIQNEFDEK